MNRPPHVQGLQQTLQISKIGRQGYTFRYSKGDLTPADLYKGW